MGTDRRRWALWWDAILMRRGEIHAVDLEPVRGSEANRRRPAVIVNDDPADLAAARLGRGG